MNDPRCMIGRNVACIAAFTLIVVQVCGCSAGIGGTHFLMAYNPDTDVTNYFRVTVSGRVYASTSKYSSGQYDRDAVNQLFGEGTLEREFLTSHLNILAASTDEDFKELKSTLEAANTTIEQIRKEQLYQSYAVAAGLVEGFKTEVEQVPELQDRFSAAIARAESLRDSALAHLGKNQTTEAAGAIRQIQIIVSSIRLAIDGRTLVRFFDGDGLEIDVRNKKEVIFVATDTERFTQALNQLTEAEDATNDLIQVVLGDQIRRKSMLTNELKIDQGLDAANASRIADEIAKVTETPADKSGMTSEDQRSERASERQALMTAIAETASVVAGAPQSFSTAEEIRSFAKGLELANAQ